MLSVLDFISNRRSSIRIAHRGGMALYPENTLEAFHFSVDNHNVEMLEMDLQITKDDKVIVLHDDSIDRTTNGTGNVIDLSYEEISEFDAGYNFKDEKGECSFRDQGVIIPLFEEVLKQLPNTYLNIELKGNNPQLVEKVQLLIPHQSSGKGVRAYSKFGGFQKEQVMDIVESTGNCVAASLPLAMVMAQKKALFSEGDLIYLVGTGAGLSIASALIKI